MNIIIQQSGQEKYAKVPEYKNIKNRTTLDRRTVNNTINNKAKGERKNGCFHLMAWR